MKRRKKRGRKREEEERKERERRRKGKEEREEERGVMEREEKKFRPFSRVEVIKNEMWEWSAKGSIARRASPRFIEDLCS